MTEITHMRRRRLLSAGAGALKPGRRRPLNRGWGDRPLIEGRGDGGLSTGAGETEASQPGLGHWGALGPGRRGRGWTPRVPTGRIDRKIEFPLPDEKTKKRIFQIHTSRMTLADDVTLDDLIMAKDDLSGADIKVRGWAGLCLCITCSQTPRGRAWQP